MPRTSGTKKKTTSKKKTTAKKKTASTKKKVATKKKTTAKKKVATKKKTASTKKVAAASRKRVTLQVQAEPRCVVYVAGSFNDWNPNKNRLREKDGLFTTTLLLEKGRYEYKFVIDSIWCADPACQEWTPNNQGSLNSVMNVT